MASEVTWTIPAPPGCTFDEDAIASLFGQEVKIDGAVVGKVIRTHAGPSSLLLKTPRRTQVLYDSVKVTARVEPWVVKLIMWDEVPVSINGPKPRRMRVIEDA